MNKYALQKFHEKSIVVHKNFVHSLVLNHVVEQHLPDIQT